MSSGYATLSRSWTDEPPDAHLLGFGAVAALESRLRLWYGLPYVVAMSSATTALHGLALALQLRDCEFVTTPYTWGGTLSGWLLNGNRPTFADVEPGGLTLDPASVRVRLTVKTKAILAVDADGVPCDMASLRRVADEAGVPLVIDAAQSLGASVEGQPASRMADAIVVSFTSGKTVEAGEGGAVVTADRNLYEHLVWWTQHPYRQRRELGLHRVNECGLNGRIHPAAAHRAARTFDRSFQRLVRKQHRCVTVCRWLQDSGAVLPFSFLQRGCTPTFFRLSAQWLGAPAPDVALAALRARGVRAVLDEDRVKPVFAQPSFPPGSQEASRAWLPVMERAAASGFYLTI